MFDKHRIRRWRRDVWRIFEREGFKPAEIMAALVLAAVSTVGTDLSMLSEITGLSTDYVKKVLRRLRRERVLRGQAISGAWGGKHGRFAVVLDAGVAAGIFTRPVDKKRSAAQKARAPETRSRGPHKAPVKTISGAVYTPRIKKSNPWYGLPERDKP